MHVRPTLGFACAAFVAILAGCSALPARSITNSHEDAQAFAHRDLAPPSKTDFAPANATPARRRNTLDRVLRVIDDEYFDRDVVRAELPDARKRAIEKLAMVASDADFYEVLKDVVARFPDSHTGILTPQEAEIEHTQRITLLGIGYSLVEGHVVITQTLPGFAAYEAGVRVGMLIDAVDDHAIDAAFLDDAAKDAVAHDNVDLDVARVQAQLGAVYGLLNDTEQPREHRLTLRRADDTIWQATVRAHDADLPTEESLTVRPSGVAVLTFSRFDPSAMEALDGDVARADAQSRALVIDLRNNLGGSFAAFTEFVEQFLAEPVELGRWSGHFWGIHFSLGIAGEPVEHPYRKPIAILTDGYTASAAELTAHALVELRGAIPVGEATCGCVVGLANEFLLPDGGVLRVAQVGFRSPHGRRMERDPLVPVIKVEPTLAQWRAAEDVPLVEAERALLERLPAAAP